MTHTPLNRRAFLTTSAAAAASLAGARALAQDGQLVPRPGPRRIGALGNIDPVAIASGNGLRTVERARAMMTDAGHDPLDAIVEGVRIQEDDPNDMTVGLGGLPNEEGVVTLDACVMHGPTHRAGAVASLENIKNPAAVAREVARRTDHVLLVGAGALQFAKRMGFKEEDLLTDAARQAWLKWRSTLNNEDDWLAPDEFDIPEGRPLNGRRQSRIDFTQPPFPAIDRPRTMPEDVPFTYGTIHCSAVNAAGDLSGCTTTSGLSWKLAGRVGDSPIIGAGCYTDNGVGSAGATGRGEAVMQVCGAHTIVTRMEAGDHPKDACIHALRKIAERTVAKRLLDDQGRPNFNVIFYAVRKDGLYGSACMHEGRQFAVADRRGVRLEDCAYLYGA